MQNGSIGIWLDYGKYRGIVMVKGGMNWNILGVIQMISNERFRQKGCYKVELIVYFEE